VSGRPLHAVALPTGRGLVDVLQVALDGGPAVLPVDPRLPVPALQRLLAAMRPAALVLPDGVRQLTGSVPVDDEIALVIATSGSTGEPKGAQLTAAALRHSAAAVLERVGAAADDRWLCCLPTFHIGGLGVLVRSLVADTDPVLLNSFSVEAFAQAAGEGTTAHTAVVPTMLRRLLDGGVDLTGFRTILVGGAALSPDLLTRAQASSAAIRSTYGMTETAGGCVYDGVPLDGVRVDVRSDQRIRITGTVLADSYRLRPDLTRDAFVDGWLVTPDLGRLDDGGRLQVLGRDDDVIITGGVNVAASAVSDLLATHPGVAQVAVVGRADAQWGQRVVAVIVAQDPAAPPTLAQLRDHVTAEAEAALAPRDLILLDAMPVLPSGKIDRRALRELSQ